MKILDDSTPAPIAAPSMLLHGLTGGGKSTWAETGGIPAVLLFEPKAMSVLRQLNPRAIGFVPESLEDLDALLVVLGELSNPTGRGMLQALAHLLYPGEAPDDAKRATVRALAEKLAKVDRVVLDSFTEMTNSLPSWLRSVGGAEVGTLVKLELQEFGSLKGYALAIVKAVQLSGLPSVIIARSVSKRVGLADSIRPDSMGKSVDDLPGKLLPTAESRLDPVLGFVIDTTPAEHSQRCGVPWVPAIYQGPCLEYLHLIQAGPQEGAAAEGQADPPAPQHEPTKATEPPQERTASRAEPQPAPKAPAAPAPPPAPGKRGPGRPKKAPEPQPEAEVKGEVPGGDDPEWVNLMVALARMTEKRPQEERRLQVEAWGRTYLANRDKAVADLRDFVVATERLESMADCPDPEKDPEGYRRAFGDVCRVLQEERRAKDHSVSQEVEEFVDFVAEGPAKPLTPPAPPAPSPEVRAYREALSAWNEAAFMSGMSGGERAERKTAFEARGPEALQEVLASTEALKVPAAPPAPGRASSEAITELLDLARLYKVDEGSLWRHAMNKGEAKPQASGAPNWFTVSATYVERITPQLREESKRRAFIPWLHNTFPNPNA